jgi:hypothetical protein
MTMDSPLKLLFVAAATALVSGAAVAATAPVSTAPAGPAPPPWTATMPDWTGVWMQSDGTNFDPAVKRSGPAGTGERQHPPFNAEYEKLYSDRLASAAAGKPLAEPGCLLSGTPRIMRSPYPMEIAVTPKQVWITHEYKGEVRRIYTDGRKHPTGDDLEPSYHGHSIGHWEGDTLVVETVGLRGDTTIDSTSMPHSDALVVRERIRRVDNQTLQDEITLDDPKAMTRPWTVTRTYKLRPDWTIKEFICAENDRNPIDANGVSGVTIK